MTESLGSRRSIPDSSTKPVDCHFSASSDTNTRTTPISPSWLTPSRNVQYHRSWKRTRSVKELYSARSQIFSTEDQHRFRTTLAANGAECSIPRPVAAALHEIPAGGRAAFHAGFSSDLAGGKMDHFLLYDSI